MAARTRAAKRRSRPGPKPRPDVARTATGRISESQENREAMTRIELEAATWRRRRENPCLSPEEARKQEHGSVISKWLHQSNESIKRRPDISHPNNFTQLHYDTAMRFAKLHALYLAVIAARNMRSASDFGGVGGIDGRDPFEEGLAKRHAKVEQDYKAARKAILQSGPLGMMAVEAAVIENKEVEFLRGDLRLALNGLATLWKLQAAAA